MRMLKLRIGDPEILRLIGKWLRAGVFDRGIVVDTEEGSPQGGPISPLLANIYLHYALDLWFEKRFLRLCRGKAYLIRFADDFVAAFEYPEEAMRFEWEVRKRIHKKKYRLIYRLRPGEVEIAAVWHTSSPNLPAL